MQVESNGSTFHCRIDGDQGPWVMLSHGLATDMTMWDELTDALKNRYRVLRYDARGHGRSAATAGDYTLAMLVADAAGILDALDIGQTHFAGLSMGGMIAQGLMLDHPKRIKSAVIADSRHTTQPEFTKAWLSRADAVRKGGIDAIVEFDRHALVERGAGRAEPGGGPAHGNHGPAYLGGGLLRLCRGAGEFELRSSSA